MDAPETDRIAALVERVHGTTATCWSCGTRGPVDPATIEPRLLLNGREGIYGRCSACAALPVGKELHRLVVASLLDLDPADRAVGGVEVPLFADEPGAHPDRPNASPWGHVSIKALARQIAKQRAVLDARRGGPCSLCGVGETPAGTTWGQFRGNPVCGGCQRSWSEDGMFPDIETIRDYVATSLAGVGSGGGRARRPGLGNKLGFKFWFEQGHREPNATPWAHVDQSRWDRILNPPHNPYTSIHAVDWQNAEARDPIDRRRGGPCACCGTDVRPHGARWVEGPAERNERGQWLSGTRAPWCSPCWEQQFGMNRHANIVLPSSGGRRKTPA